MSVRTRVGSHRSLSIHQRNVWVSSKARIGGHCPSKAAGISSGRGASKSGAIQIWPCALPGRRWAGSAVKGTRRATGFPALARIIHTPPDLVVKFQPVDIVEVILWLVLRPRVRYQREIKG